MPKTLPDRPSLEHLRKQAKDLLAAHRAAEPDALTRIGGHLPAFAELSPSAIADRPFALHDAQSVIAREHGFESWRALKGHVDTRREEELTSRFQGAVRRGDAREVRTLLARNKGLRAKVNAPLFDFDAPAVIAAKKHLDVLDVLLEHGADINARSTWWAGSFGVLDVTEPEDAAPLMARGARLDVHSAASLGMMEPLREMLDADPTLVNARGGDGVTPLHVARSPEVVDLLMDRGADPEIKDIDHHGTAVQHQIRKEPVLRRLLARGAEPDLFVAAELGDVEMARRVLERRPESLRDRVGVEPYSAPGAHIYSYTIGGVGRPFQLALARGHEEFVQFLLERGGPKDRFLFACWGADGAAARSMLAAEPGLVGSLAPEDASLMAEAAWEDRTDAVRLMVELGFPTTAIGPTNGTALHGAAWRGNLEAVEALLERDPPLHLRDPEYGSVPLGWAIHGSLYCRNPDGDYTGVVERLLAAGSDLPAGVGGSEAVAGVLRRFGVS